MSTNETFTTSLLHSPALIWRWYLENLVHFQPGSWVASTARTFRILAFLLIAPFVLLTMLDVTSYVIARTLGVIDDTKASTSDRHQPGTHEGNTPSLLASDASQVNLVPDITLSPSSADTSPSTSRIHADHQASERTRPTVNTSHSPELYFAPGSERLAGMDMLSPEASRAPSPTIRRRKLEESSTAGSGSTDSFTMLERDESGEDSGTVMRRRAGKGGFEVGGEHREV